MCGNFCLPLFGIPPKLPPIVANPEGNLVSPKVVQPQFSPWDQTRFCSMTRLMIPQLSTHSVREEQVHSPCKSNTLNGSKLHSGNSLGHFYATIFSWRDSSNLNLLSNLLRGMSPHASLPVHFCFLSLVARVIVFYPVKLPTSVEQPERSANPLLLDLSVIFHPLSHEPRRKLILLRTCVACVRFSLALNPWK